MRLYPTPRWIRDRRALRPETAEVQAQWVVALVVRAFWLRRILLRDFLDSLNLLNTFILLFSPCFKYLLVNFGKIVLGCIDADVRDHFWIVVSRLLRSAIFVPSCTSPNSIFLFRQKCPKCSKCSKSWLFSRFLCCSRNLIDNSPMWALPRFNEIYRIHQKHSLDFHIYWNFLMVIAKVSRTIVLRGLALLSLGGTWLSDFGWFSIESSRTAWT